MRDAYYEDDHDDDLAIDDMDDMNDVDHLDYAYEDDIGGADDYTYDDEDDFMVGFTDAAPELAESLREVLHERYADASPDEVEQALENLFGAMSAAEGFNFGKVLRSIGRGAKKILRDPGVSQIAKTVLPIAGGAVGTFIGGPVGTALGSQLGNLAGSAFGPSPRRRPTRVRRAPRRAVAPRPVMARRSPAGGSAAAAQLLQLTQNPNVLKSLLSLALGKQGRESVTVADGTTIPIGSFVNLLKTLSNEAASDADQLMRESRDTAAYMKDEAGEYIVDPAVPEARAETLYETLMAVENEQLMSESEGNLGYVDDYAYDDDAEMEDEPWDGEEDSAERRRRSWYRRRAARRRAVARARRRARWRARRYGYRRNGDDDAYEDDEYLDDEYDLRR